MSISTSFNMFCDELNLSSKKESIIALRYTSINKRLNKVFWSLDANYGGVYMGSYGKGTANDDVKEIDMYFVMPSYLQEKYSTIHENGQLKFLEDVRESILSIYPKTIVNKQKHTVKVNFADGMFFEILPVFVHDNEMYTYADIKKEGSWVTKNLVSDIEAIAVADAASNNSLRKLAKIAKVWKQNCDVTIKDSLLDTLVYKFIKNSNYRYDSYATYDVMCLNFFKYLMTQSRSKKEWIATGGDYQISNPSKFRYQAVVAYYKAKAAIKLVSDGNKWRAGQKWREIFGQKFPELATVESELHELRDKTKLLYKTQKKCAQLLNRQVQFFRAFQVVVFIMIMVSIVTMMNKESINTGLILFIVSSLIFLTNLYFKRYNLPDISLKHLQSATDTAIVLEEYQTLLKDFTKNHTDVAIIRERKNELQKNIHKIYLGISKYVNKKYTANTKILHELSGRKETLVSKKIGIKIYTTSVWQQVGFHKDNQVQCLMNQNMISSELHRQKTFV